MRRFAVTMGHDEHFMLPIWYRHYREHFADRDLYVIDHGSSPPLRGCLGPEVNVLRVPRDRPFSERARLQLVSSLVDSLLLYYDAGLYCDVDELVLLDGYPWDALPRKGGIDYACGFELFMGRTTDGRLVPCGQTDVYECKPALVARPPGWSAGFHTAAAPPPGRFGTALVHLKFTFPSASRSMLGTRRRVFETMDANEKASGFDQHWARDASAELEKRWRSIERAVADPSSPPVDWDPETFPLVPSDCFAPNFGGAGPPVRLRQDAARRAATFPSLGWLADHFEPDPAIGAPVTLPDRP